MKLGTNIHLFGVALLFLSSILLLFVTISAPIIHNSGLLHVQLGNSTKHQDRSLYFGTFGYCCTNCGKNNGTDICTSPHIGYNPAQLMSHVDVTTYDNIPSGTSDSFTRVMILHPVASGVAFVAFLISLGGGVVASLAGASMAFVAWIMAIIVLATDFTLFENVRHHVNNDPSESKAYLGSEIWLVVASVIMLAMGMVIVLFTCCTSHREKKRARAADKEGGSRAGSTTTVKRHWFGFLKH